MLQIRIDLDKHVLITVTTYIDFVLFLIIWLQTIKLKLLPTPAINL